MHQDLLQALAGVAVTLAGFSGVVFALGSRAEGKLSALEKSGLFHLLLTSFGVVIISLLIKTLLNSSMDETIVWRIGCAALGIFTMMGASRALMGEFGGSTVYAQFSHG